MDNTSKDSLEQLNKDILVSIADDCMTAYICLKNPGTEICYSYEDVKEALADAGVKMGINDELIHRILSEKRYNSMETVAEGKHQHGTVFLSESLLTGICQSSSP